MLDLHLEARVEHLYETIELPTSWLARLRGELETEITLRQHRNASEREFLTRKLAKAEAERRKPPDAYYAGAIDVATIKMEEARIGSDIREAEERLAAVDAHLAEWQVILETAMRFATNCARAYVPASAPTRRELRDVVVLVRSLSNSRSPLSRALTHYRKLDLSGPTRLRKQRMLPKKAMRLTPLQLTSLVQDYQSGASVYQLAKRFQVDRRTVSRKLHQQGIAMRFQPPSDALADEMIRLYGMGLTLAGVGSQVGYSVTTVRKVLVNSGVAIRGRWG